MSARKYGLMPAALGIAVLLAACGGGGGDTTTGSNSSGGGGGTPTPQSASLPVTVIDGPIQGAVVCLDKNLNGSCDAGEPQGTTDANGKVTLTIDAADQNRYPVLALVGTDAVDKDTGKVAVPFVMKAPGDQPNVVSPITTLVQVTIDNTGASTSDAAKAVQQQLGVSSSPFTDYTQQKNGDAPTLATLAQLVVATAQQQVQKLQPAVDTTALDGSKISQQDIQNAVAQAVLQSLQQVVNALGDDANKGKSVADIAKGLVDNDQLGLDATTIGGAVTVTRSHDVTPDTPTAGGNMPAFNYTDASNWSRRVLTLSTAQATPDDAHLVHYYDRRSRLSNDVLATWSFSGDPSRQNDVHWNGQAWVQCKFLQQSTSSMRDGQGRSSYDYCDKFEVGGSVRSVVQVGGRSMNDVYQQILAGGYTNVSIANAATVLGSAKFPGDSRLYLQVNTPLATAMAYVPNVGQKLMNTVADVASGDATACNKITTTTPVSTYSSLATTLDSVIAANRGTPCVFAANADSGPRNEWWSQSTVSVGQIGNAPVGGSVTSFYSGNTLLRVAFGPNNTTTYYSCQQRALNTSARNCDAIGTGTYTIAQVGDARVLSLQGTPAQFSALSYQRLFVERNGAVYYGYQNRLNVTNQARFDLTASNALFTQLGMPTIDPAQPPVLTAASYQGDWVVNDQPPLQTITGTTIHVPGNGAATSCTDNSNGQGFACTLTVDPATGAITFSSPDGSATGTFDFDTGTGGGTFTPTTGSPVTFTGERR